MKARKLKLNLGKAEILVVGTAYWKNIFKEPFKFSLSAAESPVSEEVRSLGVVIDSNLTLRHQITEIRSKQW